MRGQWQEGIVTGREHKLASGVLALFFLDPGWWSHGFVRFVKIHRSVGVWCAYFSLSKSTRTSKTQKWYLTLGCLSGAERCLWMLLRSQCHWYFKSVFVLKSLEAVIRKFGSSVEPQHDRKKSSWNPFSKANFKLPLAFNLMINRLPIAICRQCLISTLLSEIIAGKLVF